MATAIEYGLIAAGVSLAVIAVVSGVSQSSSEKLFYQKITDEKQKAAAACAARPAGDTDNVVIKGFGGLYEYSCPYMPSLFLPTYVRRVG